MPVSWESGWRFCATGSCREGICALIARPSGESALSVGQLYREEGWLTKRMGKERKEGLPYEKFMRMGAEALTDAELLAILLRTGPAPGREAAASHRDCPALGLAETLLSLPENARGGIAGLAQLSVPQLMQVKGIGEVKAVRICCLSEFSRRFGLEQRGTLPAFPDPACAARYCRPLFEGSLGEVEKVVLLLLDTKGRLLHEMVLTVGTVNLSLISPREVFLQALKYSAVHFILLHNHPSGDARPSREDAEITKELSELGRMMRIEMLDHIILGGQEYYSFREKGLL